MHIQGGWLIVRHEHVMIGEEVASVVEACLIS